MIVTRSRIVAQDSEPAVVVVDAESMCVTGIQWKATAVTTSERD
jgi:hypothetical protein